MNHYITHQATHQDAVQLFTDLLKTKALTNLKLQEGPTSPAELNGLMKQADLQLGVQAKVVMKKITLMFEVTKDGNNVDMNLIDLDQEEVFKVRNLVKSGLAENSNQSIATLSKRFLIAQKMEC